MFNIRVDIKFGELYKKSPCVELHFIENGREFRHLLEKKDGEIRCWKREEPAESSIMRRGEGELLCEENILIRYGIEIGWTISHYFRACS